MLRYLRKHVWSKVRRLPQGPYVLKSLLYTEISTEIHNILEMNNFHELNIVLWASCTLEGNKKCKKWKPSCVN